MTTLAIDYYRRNGDAERVLRLPFSLFLAEGTGDRLVVSVDAWKDGLRVKHWHLSWATPDEGLPPFDEAILPPGTPLKNDYTVLPGWRMLPSHIPDRFVFPGFRTDRSARKHLEEYGRDVSEYLNCRTHLLDRKLWLLRFVEGLYGDGTAHTGLTSRAVWPLWRRHLLLATPGGRPQPVAAEVVFGDVYPPLRRGFRTEVW